MGEKTFAKRTQKVAGIVCAAVVALVSIPASAQAQSIRYQAHVRDLGWLNWVRDGRRAGTTDEGRRMEAIKIELRSLPSSCQVSYRVHVRDLGWMGWTVEGEIAGTTGQERRMEAIQIRLEGCDEYTVRYQPHVRDIGWMGWFDEGEIAGTTDQGRRMEAIRIRLERR